MIVKIDQPNKSRFMSSSSGSGSGALTFGSSFFFSSFLGASLAGAAPLAAPPTEPTLDCPLVISYIIIILPRELAFL